MELLGILKQKSWLKKLLFISYRILESKNGKDTYL